MLRGSDVEDLALQRFRCRGLRNLDPLDHQLTSSWKVGFFLCPVSVMLRDVLLVLACFTTVLTTCYMCLPTTRSTGSPLEPVSFL